MGKIRAGPGQLSKTRGLRTLPRDGQKEEWKPTEPAGEVGFGDKAEAPCKHPTKVEETQEKLSVIPEKGASVQNRQGQFVRIKSPERMRRVLEVAWGQIPKAGWLYSSQQPP